MLEAFKRQEGTGRKVARMIVFSDFASNNGVNPMVAARQMKRNGVPVVTVALGTESRRRRLARSPHARHRQQLDRVRQEQDRGPGHAPGTRVHQPNPRRRAMGRGQIGGRGEEAREGPRDRRCHSHNRSGVHTRDTRREEGHAQGGRSGRRTRQDEQRDQHVRNGPEWRPERPVPPRFELVLGLQVHDAARSPDRETFRSREC